MLENLPRQNLELEALFATEMLHVW